MKKFKLTVAGILILALTSVFAAGIFTLAELIYRATGIQANRGELINVALFPFSQYVVSTQPPGLSLGNSNNILEGYFGHGKCDADGNITARFNSLGYRSPEFPPPGSKKPNEIRIIITGGSTAISWNIGERCTLDSLLKRSLKKAFPEKEIKIFNLGGGAWKSFQELVAIQLHGIDLDPDLIIHFSGFNDSFHAYSMPINNAYSRGLVDLAYRRYAEWVEATPNNFLQSFRIGSALKILASKAPVVLDRPSPDIPSAPRKAVSAKPGKLATALSLPLDLSEITERTDFDPYNSQVVDNYLKNEQLIARTATMKGAVLLSVLQPTLYLKIPFGEKEKRMMSSGYAPTVNFTVQAYMRLKKGLADLSLKETNMTFVDMSSPFNGIADDMFADNVHFYHGGYKIIAEKLSPTIIDIINAR